jgi:hypothetical protein
VSETNSQVDINSFVSNFVISELMTCKSHPLVLVDCIKCVMIFRNQIKDEIVFEIFKHLINALNHANQVVVSYSAICIDRYISLKRGGVLL